MIKVAHPNGDYTLIEGFDAINMAVVNAFFTSPEAYWCTKDTDEERLRAWKTSNSFALLDTDGNMVGGFRLITDKSFFGYVADVFVLKEHRGEHLAEWMLTETFKSVDYAPVKRWSLRTKDAQGLYEKIGFKRPQDQHWEMERRK